MAKKQTEIPNDKARRVMDGVAVWASFYRVNPHRFAKDYLSIDLKIFQAIFALHDEPVQLFYVHCSARTGQKAFSLLYFVAAAASSTPVRKSALRARRANRESAFWKRLRQSLMPNSANLRLEVKEQIINQAKAEIVFRNGSRIKVVVSNDNARYNRSNVIIVDEFRMVPLDVINKVA